MFRARAMMVVGMLSTVAGVAEVRAQSGAGGVLVLVEALDDSAVNPNEARSAVIEMLAERGLRLVRTPDGSPCEETGCVSTLVRSTGAELAIWLEPAETEQGLAIVARAFDGDGEVRSSRASIRDNLIARAAATAAANVLVPRPRRGFVLVRTEPPGQEVWLDGRSAGEAPLRRALRPGGHRAEIHLRGDVIDRRFTIAEGLETQLLIGPEGEDEDAEEANEGQEDETLPSPVNWLIGGALAIAGVIALVSPLSTLAADGDCVDAIEGVGCRERVQVGAQTAILLALGIAALGGAVIWDAVAPIRVAGPTTRDSAGLSFGVEF